MVFLDIFKGGVDKVVDSVMDGLDNLFTSDDERNRAKNVLAKEMNNFKLEMEDKANEFEKNITDRWKSDNEHHITRLVRPLSYIFVLGLFAIMVLGDGNWAMNIKDAYIPVIETLLATMTVAYFGSRGIEKTAKHFKGKNGSR